MLPLMALNGLGSVCKPHGTRKAMMSRSMRHVVYRAIGVTGAALGAAKKIDLTRFNDLRGPLVTLEGDHARTTASWSRLSGMYCAREGRGATCLDIMVRGARSTLDGDDGVRVDSGRS